MNDVKVMMTIEEHGRWYRFVQAESWECATCCFHRRCFGRYNCPIGRSYSGSFERFRPTFELVRIAVKILSREARRLCPFTYVVCHGPSVAYASNSDNEITFHLDGVFRDEMPEELLALIERLNALGLSV